MLIRESIKWKLIGQHPDAKTSDSTLVTAPLHRANVAPFQALPDLFRLKHAVPRHIAASTTADRSTVPSRQEQWPTFLAASRRLLCQHLSHNTSGVSTILQLSSLIPLYGPRESVHVLLTPHPEVVSLDWTGTA